MALATDRPRGTALLVEDELLVALSIVDVLTAIGFEVIGPAPRVKDALELIDQAPRLDIGILDVNLAGERSWPVARALRSNGVPFLFVTGYIEMHAALPEDLADSVLCSKPVEESEIVRAMKALRSS
jgi:chemotaxis family two-component system sensor kinase Cph1